MLVKVTIVYLKRYLYSPEVMRRHKIDRVVNSKSNIERERERERERQRETERDRQTDRETDRQTDR